MPSLRLPTEVREHERITEKELGGPFYYRRWYNCRNENCDTTIIHADEFKVWKENKAQRPNDVVMTPTEHHDGAPELLNQVSAGDPPPWE